MSMSKGKTPYEVLIRPNGQAEWVPLMEVSQFSKKDAVGGDDHFTLAAKWVAQSGNFHRLEGEVLVVHRYISTADVYFFPAATLHFVTNSSGGFGVEMMARSGTLPQLPFGIQGYVGRHPTHLNYTAKLSELDSFVALLTDKPVR